MDERTTTTRDADRVVSRAWTALAAGLLAVALHLPVSYALVKWSCATHQRTTLLLLAILAFLITVAGAGMAWSCQARLRAHADASGAAPGDRSLFVAQAALGIDAILALFIAASVIGPLVISPCA